MLILCGTIPWKSIGGEGRVSEREREGMGGPRQGGPPYQHIVLIDAGDIMRVLMEGTVR